MYPFSLPGKPLRDLCAKCRMTPYVAGPLVYRNVRVASNVVLLILQDIVPLRSIMDGEMHLFQPGLMRQVPAHARRELFRPRQQSHTLVRDRPPRPVQENVPPGMFAPV